MAVFRFPRTVIDRHVVKLQIYLSSRVAITNIYKNDPREIFGHGNLSNEIQRPAKQTKQTGIYRRLSSTNCLVKAIKPFRAGRGGLVAAEWRESRASPLSAKTRWILLVWRARSCFMTRDKLGTRQDYSTLWEEFVFHFSGWRIWKCSIREVC